MLNRPQETACVQQVCWLPLDRITPRMSQPFGREDSQSMAEMCESIRRDGLLQPITVQRMGNGGFMIVSGNRRYMACRMLGMTHIDAVVLPGPPEDQSLQEKLEMLLSRRMHYLDEARAMAEVLDSGVMDRESLARSLGMTSASLREKLRLLELDEGLCILLVEQGLPERIARALLRLPDEEARLSALAEIVRRQMNVARTEEYVEQLLAEKPVPARSATYIIKDVRLFLNSIDRSFQLMRQSGVNADLGRRDTDSEILLTIRIPKGRAARGT